MADSAPARVRSQADLQATELRITGGDALARQLVREGVELVFGVPGNQLDWAVDGFAKTNGQIDFVATRHEQGASYMADGYARSTDRVGVFMVVPGPGLLNAMAGLATAYACSSPVLCIAAQIPSGAIGRGFGLLHEVQDQSGTLGTVTKWQALARSPEEIPQLVREACRQMRNGRPQPVGLEVPPDIFQAEGDVELLDPPGDDDALVVPDPARLEEAAAMLRAARRPVIYVGWGIQAANASEELHVLAEALQAPVVMSSSGKGSLTDRHPLALPGFGGRAILPHADAVLVVGSRFLTGVGEPVFSSPRARFVYLNADQADLREPRRADVAIHGDAKLGLAALAHLVADGHSRPSRVDEVALVRAWCDVQIAEIEPQLQWVRALRAAIPEDGILVTEMTQVGYLAEVAYPVYAPRTFLTAGYQGTLGYGFPTALGAAAGNPGRAVVSITGDGGFGWGLSELATARKYDLGLVTVVFTDDAFGNVRRTQRTRFGGRILGSELANPDFVRLADAFGVEGARAETPDALERLLAEALAAGRPALIEVPMREVPSAWHLLHPFVPPPRPAPPNPLDELPES